MDCAAEEQMARDAREGMAGIRGLRYAVGGSSTLKRRAAHLSGWLQLALALGALGAGMLVAWTGSRLPDLVIGAFVAFIVAAGALRILRLR